MGRIVSGWRKRVPRGPWVRPTTSPHGWIYPSPPGNDEDRGERKTRPSTSTRQATPRRPSPGLRPRQRRWATLRNAAPILYLSLSHRQSGKDFLVLCCNTPVVLSDCTRKQSHSLGLQPHLKNALFVERESLAPGARDHNKEAPQRSEASSKES